ncbi:MAG: ATP-binding protein [Sumerlaeia bacterium]
MQKSPADIEFNLLSDPRQLVIVCTAVRQFAQIHGLDEKSQRQLELAVDEVCSNVICHAYKGNREKHYRVRCSIQNNQIIVEVVDHGIEFTLQDYPKPKLDCSLKERQSGGLGIHFVKKLMDELEYIKLPTGENCCRMKKTLNQQPTVS